MTASKRRVTKSSSVVLRVGKYLIEDVARQVIKRQHSGAIYQLLLAQRVRSRGWFGQQPTAARVSVVITNNAQASFTDAKDLLW